QDASVPVGVERSARVLKAGVQAQPLEHEGDRAGGALEGRPLQDVVKAGMGKLGEELAHVPPVELFRRDAGDQVAAMDEATDLDPGEQGTELLVADPRRAEGDQL